METWGVVSILVGIVVALFLAVGIWVAVIMDLEEDRLDNTLTVMVHNDSKLPSRIRRVRELRSRLSEPSLAIRKPVVLLQGLGSSPLYYRDGDKWRHLWASAEVIVPKGRLTSEDWKARMRVRYDRERDEFLDTYPNIEVTAWRGENYDKEGRFFVTDDCGGVAGGCDIVFHPKMWTPGPLKSTKGFRYLVNALTETGYQVGRSLFGLGYDFRRITGKEYWPEFCKRFRDVLRTACYTNGGNKVLLLTHSMGALLFIAFCQDYPEARDYVDLWVPVNAPFGGSTGAIHAALCGSSFGMSPFGPPGQCAWFQDLECSFSGLLLNFPHQSAFGNREVVRVDGKVYTCNDHVSLLREMGVLNAALALEANVGLFRSKCYGVLPDGIGFHSLTTRFSHVGDLRELEVGVGSEVGRRSLTGGPWVERWESIGVPLCLYYERKPYRYRFAGQDRELEENPYAGKGTFAARYVLTRVLDEAREARVPGGGVRGNLGNRVLGEQGGDGVLLVGDGTVPWCSLNLHRGRVLSSPPMEHSAVLSDPVFLRTLLDLVGELLR